MSQYPHCGILIWIGLRPKHQEPMISVSEVVANSDSGLEGDRYQGTSGKRQVTLIQFEHLEVISSFTGLSSVTPEQVRRNLVIKGINLLTLKNQFFRIGEVIFETTGLCHPCSRMEKSLGEGGYNAMRGHGGLTAAVVQGGLLKLDDEVSPVPSEYAHSHR